MEFLPTYEMGNMGSYERIPNPVYQNSEEYWSSKRKYTNFYILDQILVSQVEYLKIWSHSSDELTF